MRDPKPWAYMAIKGDKFGGVCAPEASRATLDEFLSSMVADGYSIKPVFSRDEYNSELARLK